MFDPVRGDNLGQLGQMCLFAASDITGLDTQPSLNASPGNTIFLMVFVLRECVFWVMRGFSLASSQIRQECALQHIISHEASAMHLPDPPVMSI